MFHFTKMHGLGNDYIYVDCISNNYPSNTDWGALAKKLSQRRFSVGSDGLILILPSKVAHCRMRIFNQDGSEGEMCGNGVCCVAKYVYDHQLKIINPLFIETLSGVIVAHLFFKDGFVDEIKVDMGEPLLKYKEIPILGDSDNMAIDVSFFCESLNLSLTGTGVRIGPPHVVFEVESLDDYPVDRIGAMLEKHPILPQRANIHFIQIINPSSLRMRVYERGSGETLACGTGACAAVVASVLNKKTERLVQVSLLGGELLVLWDPISNHVFLKGRAIEVYSGTIQDLF